MQLILPLQNIKLIDFSHIVKTKIETPLINDLNEFGLIVDDSINLKNREVKRLMYHHFIYGLCEYLLELKSKQKAVIHYCELIPCTSQLSDYLNTAENIDFFNKLIIKISKILPIKILITDITFKMIKREIKNGNGSAKDITRQAQTVVDKLDISKYTFTKARYFAKRYGLKYLSNKYFQKIKSKQLILS